MTDPATLTTPEAVQAEAERLHREGMGFLRRFLALPEGLDGTEYELTPFARAYLKQNPMPEGFDR